MGVVATPLDRVYVQAMATNVRQRRPHAGTRPLALLAVIVTVALALSPVTNAATLGPEVEEALRESPYVYLASQREDGAFGEPAEIWFMFEDGAVWVGTRKTSWRAKRIRAGRAAATIAVGTREGPTFNATGAIVKDEKMYATMFRTFAKKYPSGWLKHEEGFRTGFADGSRVLIRYDPQETASPSP